jgi:ribonuclease HI
MRQVVGSTWGVQPKFSRWAYTGIVRPALTYGSIVWAQAAQKPQMQKALQRMQRLAALSIAPVRRSTPTAGLEVMLYLIPLDIYVQGEAIKSFSRIQHLLTDNWKRPPGKHIGHRSWLRDQITALAIPEYPRDKMSLALKWDRTFEVALDSFSTGVVVPTTGLNCFTDGSKIEDQGGAGYIIDDGSARGMPHSIPLGSFCTVYQAEIMAIMEACQELESLQDFTEVTIYCDSQAALKSLAQTKFHSKLTWECALALDRLGQHKKVTLRWVKAHVGTAGNEAADMAAKSGTRIPLTGPEPCLPVSEALYKKNVRLALEQYWQQRWQSRQDCRQSRLFFPKVSRAKAYDFIRESRKTCGRIIQFLTGHNRMNRHESIIDPSKSKTCRLCLEGEESSAHIMFDCPTLQQHRADIFQARFLQTTMEWNPQQIKRFLSREKLVEMLEGSV